MDDTQLNEIAEKLDALAETGSAKLRTVAGKPQGFLFVHGNQSGFLRLAACCLRTATSPILEDYSSRPISLGEKVQQVFDPAAKTDHHLGFFERVGNFPVFQRFVDKRKSQGVWWNRVMLFGCVAFFLVPWILGIGALIGLIVVR